MARGSGDHIPLGGGIHRVGVVTEPENIKMMTRLPSLFEIVEDMIPYEIIDVVFHFETLYIDTLIITYPF